jgi:alkylhydroperoxidase/carboxymuconolactone decarboxylase family protein YurZ
LRRRKKRELLRLAAPLALRRDECFKHYFPHCDDEGVADGEWAEGTGVGVMVGGWITIRHGGPAVRAWEQLQQKGEDA